MSLTIRVYLHLFSHCCLLNQQMKFRINLDAQQLKVIDLGANQKSIIMQLPISHQQQL